MNRQDAEKWARALRPAPSWSDSDREALVAGLLREFPEPAPLCHVCDSQMNGDTCPKCQPEAPPDVSALRFEGKEVEIAEPKPRIPVPGELIYDTRNGGKDPLVNVAWGSMEIDAWILRIKEQSPQSMRTIGEMIHDEGVRRAAGGRAPIIAREVEERKPRRLICESCDVARCQAHGELLAGHLINRRPLADLNDPKVVNAVLLQSNWNLAGSIHDQAKSLIQAYLEYPCKS